MVLIRLVAGVLLGVLATGCANPGLVLPVRSGDTTHYLIVGFGIVSVSDLEEERTAVSVTRVQALGTVLSVGPGGSRATAGYLSNTVVRVPTDVEDVRVEVRPGFGSAITVEAQCAVRGRDGNSNNGGGEARCSD